MLALHILFHKVITSVKSGTKDVNLPVGKLGIRAATICPLTAIKSAPSGIQSKTPFPSWWDVS